jgi:hypothetical protein
VGAGFALDQQFLSVDDVVFRIPLLAGQKIRVEGPGLRSDALGRKSREPKRSRDFRPSEATAFCDARLWSSGPLRAPTLPSANAPEKSLSTVSINNVNHDLQLIRDPSDVFSGGE